MTKANSLGYAGTPLIKKLGIKEGFAVQIVNAPASYVSLLGKLPERVIMNVQSVSLDVIHVFFVSRQELQTQLPALKRHKKARHDMDFLA